MKQFAAELDLDTDTFNQCLDSGKYTSLVNEQRQLAQQIGVSSTPAFIVNGQPFLGAQPYENFQQLIESSLASEQ